MTDFDFKKPQKQFTSFKTQEKVNIQEPPKFDTPSVEKIDPISKLDKSVEHKIGERVEIAYSEDLEDESFEKSLKELEQKIDEEIAIQSFQDLDNLEAINLREAKKLPVNSKPAEKKNKKFLIILLIGVLLLSSLGFGLYQAGDKLAFWNKSEEVEASNEDKKGTFVTYDEGEVTADKINANKTVYNNSIFPDFQINSDKFSWAITESDKSKEEQIKYDIILKNGDLNLVFSFYTDNGGLRSGNICLRDTDVIDIDQNWVYEKRYNEVYEDQIGFYFVPSINYTVPTSPDFEGKYNDYVQFISGYTKNIVAKQDAAYCAPAQRVIKTKTSVLQSTSFNDENQVLLRIFTPKSNLTDEDITKINDIISSIKY